MTQSLGLQGSSAPRFPIESSKIPSSPSRSTLAAKSEKSTITHLAYSPSGAQITGATAEATLFVWASSSGHLILGPFNEHSVSNIIYHIDFVSELVILSAANDHTVRLWDARTGEGISVFEKHEDAVLTAVCLPDKQTFTSVSKDGAVIIWNSDTLEVIDEFHIELDSCLTVALSPDGRRLVGTARGTARVWDLEGRQMLTEIDLSLPMLIAAVFSHDNSQIILGCGDDVLRCLDVESGEIIGEPFEGHSDGLSDIVCSPNGKLIASAAFDGAIRVWNAHEHTSVITFEGLGPLAISPDSQYLARTTTGNALIIEDLSMVVKEDSISSFLDLPATEIPQGLRNEFGTSDPISLLDFAATSRPADWAQHVPRESIVPKPQKTLGGRFSGLWKQSLRGLSRRNNDARSATSKDRPRRFWIAGARDRNPLVIAPAAKRKQEQSSQEQPAQENELSRTETSTSTSESESDRNPEEEEEENHGCCHTCCVWICFKMPFP